MLLSKKVWCVLYTVEVGMEERTALQDPIDVFPEIKLRILVPNLIIHVSEHGSYIPTICPHILLQKNRRIDLRNL